MSRPNVAHFPMGLGAFQHVYLAEVVLNSIRPSFEADWGRGWADAPMKRLIESVGTRGDAVGFQQWSVSKLGWHGMKSTFLLLFFSGFTLEDPSGRLDCGG